MPYYPLPPDIGSYVTESESKKPISQLALMSIILATAGWPLLATAGETCNYPHTSTYIAIVAIIVGHLAFLNRKRDHRLAIRGLIVGYLLLASVGAFAIVKWGSPDLALILHWPGWSPPPSTCP